MDDDSLLFDLELAMKCSPFDVIAFMSGIFFRDVAEIRESERRANSQAEVLRNALEEHNLELRVRAAHEAEAACQQRLSAAEAEIADLRDKLDASEKLVSLFLIFNEIVISQ